MTDTQPPVPAEETPTGNQADVLLNLESLIKNHIARIDSIKEDAKKHGELLTNTFANDSTYKLHEDKAKEAAKIKQKTKSEIMKRKEVAVLAEKVKEMKSELKELEGALSDYLREYARMSGTNEIQGEDGEVREIVYIAKLVKKSSKKFK